MKSEIVKFKILKKKSYYGKRVLLTVAIGTIINKLWEMLTSALRVGNYCVLSPLTWMVGLVNKIYGGTYHSCERREYAFMVLREYLIIFPLGHWLRIQLKKVFMGKEKKKFLTTFFISYKSDIKTFLKWIVNECPKGIR